ncbi:carboxy terminal-processing peptidase, partial [Dickeya sp. DW 0440]
DVKPLLPGLLEQHNARIAKDPEFQFIQQDVARYQEMKEKRNHVSLNLAQRQKDNNEEEASRLMRINDRLKRQGKPPLKSLDDLPKDYQDPDAYLSETVQIAQDLSKTLAKPQ